METGKPVLEIKDLNLHFHLGCEAWEREHAQLVKIDVTFEFDQPPVAETSDELSDTLCYAEICKSLQQLQQKHYKLIEHIGHDALEKIRPLLTIGGRVNLSVHKVKPPVDDLQGGVIYRLFARL